MKTTRAAMAALLLACTIPVAAHAARSASDEFQAGLSAFHKHRYAHALQHFLQAEHAGMHTPALYYDIGVSAYRTGNYDLARKAFLKSSTDPSLASVSHYNLGLVAHKQGHDGAARYWFALAERHATTRRLREMSASRLKQLPKPKRWFAAIRAGAGYDDNAVLASGTQLVNASHRGAAYGTALVLGQGLLAGNWSRGLRAKGLADMRRYSGLAHYNLSIYQGGIEGTTPVGAWRTGAGLEAGRVDFGGGELDRSLTATLHARRHLAHGLGLALRYSYATLHGGSGYAYLGGWRQTLRAGLRGSVGKSRWRAWYQHEWNARRDLYVGSNFYSFSPRRDTVGVSWKHPLMQQLSVEARASYQYSRYGSPDRIGGLTRTRVDREPRLVGYLRYHLSPWWIASCQLGYEDNASNIPGDSYHRKWGELAIERLF
ncbi:MAG TPA: tetratricopeptide repeat protein [Gammaproteobacteria bacterium]|nr:tetratricopeptide repeat protein [Gammaproteobacteria bacterium]